MSFRHSVVDLSTNRGLYEFSSDLRVSKIGEMSHDTYYEKTPVLSPLHLAQVSIPILEEVPETPSLSLCTGVRVHIYARTRDIELTQNELIYLDKSARSPQTVECIAKTQLDTTYSLESDFTGPRFLEISTSAPVVVQSSYEIREAQASSWTQYDMQPDFDTLLSTLTSHPDCPMMLRDILLNVRSLGKPIPETASPGEEQANAFVPVIVASLVDESQDSPEVAETPLISSPHTAMPDNLTPVLPSLGITPVMSPVNAHREATFRVDDILGPPVGIKSRQQVIEEDPVRDLPQIDEDIVPESMRRFRMNIRAVTALVRFQKHMRRRYEDQRNQLINDLGL